jgi:hypothetical protein
MADSKTDKSKKGPILLLPNNPSCHWILISKLFSDKSAKAALIFLFEKQTSFLVFDKEIEMNKQVYCPESLPDLHTANHL